MLKVLVLASFLHRQFLPSRAAEQPPHRLLAGVPVYGAERTSGDSALEDWILRLPKHWTSADLLSLGSNTPGQSSIVSTGHPSEGGMAMATLRGTLGELQEFLATHPDIVYAERSQAVTMDGLVPAPAQARFLAPTPAPERALQDTAPSVIMLNIGCPDMAFLSAAAYRNQGSTSTGAPYYSAFTRANMIYIFFDPSCDGGTAPGRWVISNTEPSTVAARQLTAGGCSSYGYLTTDNLTLPMDNNTWRIACGGSWQDVSLSMNLPSASPPHVSFRGSCPVREYLDGLSFQVQGFINGAPWYFSPMLYMYFDPSCDGQPSTSPMWIIDEVPPDTTKTQQLRSDGQACNYLGRIGWFDFTTPPLGVQTWRVLCGAGWTEVSMEINYEYYPWSPWGLDRLDQRALPLDRVYAGTQDAGQGVHIYVFDGGIRTTHADFEGRAIPTLDILNGNLVVCDPADSTCAADSGNGQVDGHGTHVAGIAGGRTYGVAKSAILHAVKVFENSQSNTKIMVDAIDWVMSNAVMPALMSLSVSSDLSPSKTEAVENAIAAGIVVVVSAGNQASDACMRSPANVPSVITVGSISRNDTRHPVSNYGTCVDIFAPGGNVESAYHLRDMGGVEMTGTSMAAPYVSGVVAWLMANQGTTMTPAEAWNMLRADATRDVVIDAKDSPNLLVYQALERYATTTTTSTFTTTTVMQSDVIPTTTATMTSTTTQGTTVTMMVTTQTPTTSVTTAATTATTMTTSAVTSTATATSSSTATSSTATTSTVTTNTGSTTSATLTTATATAPTATSTASSASSDQGASTTTATTGFAGATDTTSAGTLSSTTAAAGTGMTTSTAAMPPGGGGTTGPGGTTTLGVTTSSFSVTTITSTVSAPYIPWSVVPPPIPPNQLPEVYLSWGRGQMGAHLYRFGLLALSLLLLRWF